MEQVDNTDHSVHSQGYPRPYDYILQVGEEKLVKRVYRANVEGNMGRGRPRRRWRDEVRDFLVGRGLSEGGGSEAS